MSAVGRVKWFGREKGYGFVEVEGTSDVFVHYSAIVCEHYRVRYEGQKVTLCVVRGRRGLQAEKVVQN
jgi:CspA family cold shock protein